MRPRFICFPVDSLPADKGIKQVVSMARTKTPRPGSIPPPLVFSAEDRKFTKVDKSCMVQFLALGLQIPEDHPDRNRYFSMQFRQRRASPADVAEITLINPGDVLFLYTDGVYDGSDEEERQELEAVMREHSLLPAKDICNALLEHAQKEDDHLRQIGEQDRIDDKTVFIIKRN